MVVSGILQGSCRRGLDILSGENGYSRSMEDETNKLNVSKLV